MPEVLLRTENLTKHFPVKSGVFQKGKLKAHALDGVDLTVYGGEVLGVVGESGSGKSTLARVILRLLEPTAGTIEFEGKDLTHMPAGELREVRKHMQIVFQDPFSSLNPRKRVRQLIAEPLDIHGIGSRKDRMDRVKELLEIVGLNKDYADRFPHQFSGGQRQRIGIARALVLNPKLVVCDEPVSALDVSVQAQVLNLLKDLQDRFGLTYMFIAHGLDVVRHISDRIAVMYLGKLVEVGSCEEVFERPRHPYTQALISAIPVPDPTVAQAGIKLVGEIPSPISPPAGCRFHTRCPYAMPRCASEEPLLVADDGGHATACHLMEERS